MRPTLFALLLISLAAHWFRAQDIEPRLKQHVEGLILKLQDESALKRRWAARQLIVLGEPVVPIIASHFAAQNFVARREMATILAEIGTLSARDRLIQCLCDPDRGVRGRVILELLYLSDRDPEVLEKVKKIEHGDPEIQQDIRILKETILHKTIEQGLANLISEQGGWGFYAGQFDHLLPLGEDAIPVLLEIFTNENYQFVVLEYSADVFKIQTIRYLAGDALGDFEPYLAERKSEVISALKAMRRYENFQDRVNNQMWEIAAYTLFRLGHKEPLNRRILALKRKVEDGRQEVAFWNQFGDKTTLEERQRELASSCSELALVYLRIRQDAIAIELLNEAVANNPEDSLSYYNLACAYACLGEIERGLDALETSVKKGYRDLGWILKDGDLRPLHKSPRFQKLIKDLEDQLQKPK